MISLAVGLIVLASIIWWQNGRIKQLEAQYQQAMEYDAFVALSNVIIAKDQLDSTLSYMRDSDLDGAKRQLGSAMQSWDKATISVTAYNRKLYNISKARIYLLEPAEFSSFRWIMEAIDRDLPPNSSISSQKLEKLQDVRDDIQLLYDTFSKAIEQGDPHFVTQQMNGITKDMKSQSIRQDLGLMPTLAGLNVTSSNEIQQSVAIETKTNCVVIGETATWIIEVANNNSEPLTLSGTPPFDVVILDQASQIRERWSQSPTFPPNTGAVLNSGETRSYTWNWPVHDRYGNAITIRADVPSIGNSEVEISVNAVTYVDASGAKQTIACADL